MPQLLSDVWCTSSDGFLEDDDIVSLRKEIKRMEREFAKYKVEMEKELTELKNRLKEMDDTIEYFESELNPHRKLDFEFEDKVEINRCEDK